MEVNLSEAKAEAIMSVSKTIIRIKVGIKAKTMKREITVEIEAEVIKEV